MQHRRNTGVGWRWDNDFLVMRDLGFGAVDRDVWLRMDHKLSLAGIEVSRNHDREWTWTEFGLDGRPARRSRTSGRGPWSSASGAARDALAEVEARRGTRRNSEVPRSRNLDVSDADRELRSSGFRRHPGDWSVYRPIMWWRREGEVYGDRVVLRVYPERGRWHWDVDHGLHGGVVWGGASGALDVRDAVTRGTEAAASFIRDGGRRNTGAAPTRSNRSAPARANRAAPRRGNAVEIDDRLDRAYRAFNHHAPKTLTTLAKIAPKLKLPAALAPSGGMARVWYDSDKIMERGDRVDRVNSYVHCVLPQPDPRPGKEHLCVCGHPVARGEHETVRSFAQVYGPAKRGKGAVRIEWPERVYLIGRTIGHDEVRGDRVHAVRHKGGKGWVLASPDSPSIIIVHGTTVRVVEGGEMRITPDGIAG